MAFSIGYQNGTATAAAWTNKLVRNTITDTGVNAFIQTPNIRTISVGYIPVPKLRRTIQTGLAGAGGSARPASGLLFPRGVPTRDNN